MSPSRSWLLTHCQRYPDDATFQEGHHPTPEVAVFVRPADAAIKFFVRAIGGWGRVAKGFRFRSRILALALALSGGAVVSPERATAVEAPTPKKTYVAFFLGQGGYIFSWGIPYLAAQAHNLGIETGIFRYYELRSAWKKITQKKAEGYKIGLVGYSLGNTTATYIQKHLEVDLLLAVAQSSLGRNHLVKKRNTRRSVLWYGPDFLSNAGLKNGFDELNYVYNTHLLMDVDPRVVKPVLDELQDLAQFEKSDRTEAASRTSDQTIRVASADDGILTGSTRTPMTVGGGQWVPHMFPINEDVTCARCWGFQETWLAPETRQTGPAVFASN